MSVSNKRTTIASQTLATTLLNGTNITVNNETKALIVECKVSNRTDGTYTFRLQESWDGGTNWEQFGISTAVASNDTVLIKITENIDGAFFPMMRIVITATSVTIGATVEANIWHD
jgi:hypothetical protein